MEGGTYKLREYQKTGQAVFETRIDSKDALLSSQIEYAYADPQASLLDMPQEEERVMTESAAQKSLYAMMVKPSQFALQRKANESRYREYWKSKTQKLSEEEMPLLQSEKVQSLSNAERMDDSDSFEKLVMSEKTGANSPYYNAVIEKAEIFHQLQRRGTLSLEELAAASHNLIIACDAYLSTRNPHFSKGKERKKLIEAERIKAQDVYEAICKKDLCATRKGLIFSDLKKGENLGETRHERVISYIKTVIDTWMPPQEEYSEDMSLRVKSLTESLKAKMSVDKLITENMLIHLFTMLPKGDRSKETAQKNALETMPEEQLKINMKTMIKAVQETMGDIVFWGTQIDGAYHITDFEPTASDLHERGMGVCIVEYSTVDNTKERRVIKPEEKKFEHAIFSSDDHSFASIYDTYIQKGRIRKKKDYDRSILSCSGIRTIDIQLTPDGMPAHGSMIEYIAHKQAQEVLDEGISSQVDDDQMVAAQIFCGLFGLSDMHKENLVYESYTDKNRQAKLRAVMVDADNALDFNMIGLRRAGNQNGFLLKWPERQGDKQIDQITIANKGHLIDLLLDNICTDDMVCRTVPITTGTHSNNRATIQIAFNNGADVTGLLDLLKNTDDRDSLMKSIMSFLDGGNGTITNDQLKKLFGGDSIPEHKVLHDTWDNTLMLLRNFYRDFDANPTLNEKGNIHIPSMKGVLGRRVEKTEGDKTTTVYEGITITPQQKWDATLCAFEDYINGKIPFYEFHIATGKVTTHGDVVVGVVHGNEGESMRDYYKRILMDDPTVISDSEDDDYQLDHFFEKEVVDTEVVEKKAAKKKKK